MKKTLLFGLGGSAYVGLEYLYRGRSHISMFGAGGVCFLLLGQVGRMRWPMPVRAGVGAGIITVVELATGLLFNRDHQVWDYREQWGNYRGQICPAFTAVWFPVAALGMGLYALAEKRLVP